MDFKEVNARMVLALFFYMVNRVYSDCWI